MQGGQNWSRLRAANGERRERQRGSERGGVSHLSPGCLNVSHKNLLSILFSKLAKGKWQIGEWKMENGKGQGAAKSREKG